MINRFKLFCCKVHVFSFYSLVSASAFHLESARLLGHPEDIRSDVCVAIFKRGCKVLRVSDRIRSESVYCNKAPSIASLKLITREHLPPLSLD